MKQNYILHFAFLSFLFLLSSCAEDQVDINFDMNFSELTYEIDPIEQPELEKTIIDQTFESGLEDALQLQNSDINQLRSVHLNHLTVQLKQNSDYSFNDFVKLDVYLEKDSRNQSTIIATTNLNSDGLTFAHFVIKDQDLSSFFENGEPIIKIKAITRQAILLPFILETDFSFKVAATIEE